VKLKYKDETMLMNLGEDRAKHHGAVVPPIYQNSLFTFESWEDIDTAFENRTESYFYTRVNNPTTNITEQKIAALAGGKSAKLFGSGMAAISAAVMHYLTPGAHVVTINNVYGPTNNFFASYLKKKMDISTTFVSGNEISDFENAIDTKTKLIYLESPSSVIFSLQDIEAVANLAKSKGIRTIIDNTWATPVFQKPLTMGIDMEVHSCSKYIGGHSDLVAGVLISSKEEIKKLSVDECELLGGKISPLESWLIMRSLRTLPIRMKQHQESSLKIAEFLDQHPKVKKVNYPGLKSFPQFELGKKQMRGYSGLMGFELATDDLNKIKIFFNSLHLFHIGVSWGGHESLIYAPAISYLKELSKDKFAAMGISLGDMRISVGLENHDDLIDDLNNALKIL
jgi:cystathionine beta-lyase